MTRAAWLAALLAAAAPLAAAHAEDSRLVERLYDPAEVVRVEGRTNVQAMIRFGEDEHIENVAIGDSQQWQVTPNKRANLLFVKPLAERAATNMTVVTDKHTYLFDLVASPAHRNPLYVLAFSYPDEPDAEDTELAADSAGRGPNAIELAAVSDPYAVIDPAALNHAWDAKGDARLFPSKIYDDGDATFLIWSTGATLPAILVKDHEGTEGPVNFAVRGEVIVVDGVPREIVLRAGGDSATLLNRGPVREPRRPALAQARTATETQ